MSIFKFWRDGLVLKWLRRISEVKNSYDFYALESGYRKSFTARVIDAVFICTIVIMPLFLLGVNIAGSVILPLIFSTSLFLISLLLFYIHFKREYKNLKELTYKQIKSQELEKLLDNISLDNFQSLIINFLLKNNIFSNVVIGRKSIEGIAKDIRYTIGYDVVDPKETTSWETVETFVKSIQATRQRNIIFFTNTYFEEICHSLKESFEDFTIYLIERDHIIKLLMHSNIVLKDGQLEEIVTKKYAHRRQMTKVKKYNIASDRKVRDLFLYSFIFILLAFLGGQYFIYYTVISLVFFILAITSFLFNQKEVKRSNDILGIKKKIGL